MLGKTGKTLFSWMSRLPFLMGKHNVYLLSFLSEFLYFMPGHTDSFWLKFPTSVENCLVQPVTAGTPQFIAGCYKTDVKVIRSQKRETRRKVPERVTG